MIGTTTQKQFPAKTMIIPGLAGSTFYKQTNIVLQMPPTFPSRAITSVFFFLCCQSPAFSMDGIYAQILRNIQPHTVTFIGESHKHTESAIFFEGLVSAVLEKQGCTIVGLEIGSDQQPILDQIMEGQAKVDQLRLWESIDHKPYRDMIGSFSAAKQHGKCLEVLAIDSGIDNKTDRDEWMAGLMAKQVGNKPVLVLVGGLHTLKRIAWTRPHGKSPVAEILAKIGIAVHSYPQRWLDGSCGDPAAMQGRFMKADNPKALDIINRTMVSLVKAKPFKSLKGAVDGLVLWECARN
ncbi:MAG: hypothetical protein CTY16_14775 [Methylobacter sp.]|nr:MAG: hypothetical protein CTY16_14775 [Methylobacter sp.]